MSETATLFNEATEVSESTALQAVPADDSRGHVMSIIESCATNPDFDVRKMRALLAMKRELDAEEREYAYTLAMRNAQDEMRPVVREKMNNHTKAKYATLEQVHEACKPIWLKHGFSLSSHSDVSPIPGYYRVITVCSHVGKHKTTHFLDAPPDDAGPKGEKNKTPIQALGSTVSYVRRYLDLMIFDITLIGEDRDGNRTPNGSGGGPVVTDAQALQIEALVADHDLKEDMTRLFKWLKVVTYTEIPADKHDEVLAALNRKINDRRKGR